MGEGVRARRIVVLGSTGSVGRAALEVVRRNRARVKVVGLAARSSVGTLVEQAREFMPEVVALADPQAAAAALGQLGGEWKGRVLAGTRGVAELARWSSCDLVLNAIVGFGGLEATLAALDAGKLLALSNKESLVAGGHLVVSAQRRGGGRILPVDSEHAALVQCLAGRETSSVRRLLITASGGPFLRRRQAELRSVTPGEALAHPNWRMGPRITIDSATMFNKGMEVIEARWLFGVPMERISVVVHPQSIVHGMVELHDGSIVAALGPADMKIPIQGALLWPETPAEGWGFQAPLDLAKVGALTFEELEKQRFPAFAVALEAASRGEAAPAWVNAADEVLVEAFLAGTITFPAISEGLTLALEQFPGGAGASLEDLKQVDASARRVATGIVDRLRHRG